ncbi:hypothetical protein BS47DRAFT_1393474 [Hydnum rufescens UP504]|uniref:Uncharacterized protein n=1 Tax=Hydnum rufescens UP504 TaxID=1448309 RepID=A0A9P6AWQ4_9AGAM|nr:hypothetical protein BS47DRAFT_1393474 [Hydnum rufescens UP504]
MVWMKFAPAQYNSTYFMYDEELQEWHMDWELLITVQTGIKRLQNVISDIIAIVGNEDHCFVIDCKGKLAEQLWMSKRIEELRMADKLLKLRVELTFARLYKLRKLHQGESLSTPMASEDSLPPTPELREHLYKAWHNPRLPMKRAMRHLFMGNQAMKYAEYDVRLEEALDVQPLPRVDTNPHGLGLFAPSSDFKEPSGDASFDPSHGPKAGPGSIINLPAWPTPPADQTRLGNSSMYQASSIDLDTSLLTWQDVPLHDSTPRESATPMLNPRNWLAVLLQWSDALWGDILVENPPCFDLQALLMPAHPNQLPDQTSKHCGQGIEYPSGAWDSVMDTPALPALGATRAHNYYTEPSQEPEGPSTIPTSSQSSSQKEGHEPPMENSKGKSPQPPPPPHSASLKEGRGRPPDDDGGPGKGGGGPGRGGPDPRSPSNGGSPGPGSPPGHPGPSGPLGPPGASSNAPPPGMTWDNRLKWMAVPEWDGDQETVIDWLYECSDLMSLCLAVESQIAQIATFWFRGAVTTAWRAHSAPVKHSILQSWDNLWEWVLHCYLGEAWYTAQQLKYNEGTFRSGDHPDESPAEYIQWCILLSRIFLHFTPNSPEETLSVMNNAPTEWDVILRWSDRPLIESVLMYAKQFKATLVMQWRSSQHYQRCQESKNSKRVNFIMQEDAVERSNQESLHSQYSDDPEGAFRYSSEEAEGGKASSMALNIGKRPGGKSYRSPHHAYPQEGRADNAEKTYPYPWDDTVVSHHKPGQKCFACGSEKHWVRDSKHFRVYSNHLERRTLKKEHRRYKMPSYKAAYSAMVDATQNFQIQSR